MERVKGLFVSTLLIILIVVLLLVFIEGCCSVWYSFEFSSNPIKERLHTKYDSEIGWVNIPNIRVNDIYGPGTFLRTNSQGFRNDKDFLTKVPDGKVRIICSGDSYTLGYGVSNNQDWCCKLASLDSRLEPVNMGQGGYGVDQAYLLYKREGVKLEHQFQLFAFIAEDIMVRNGDKLAGYGKPYFRLENDKLVLSNVPVPNRPYYIPWITTNISRIKELRLVKMLSSLIRLPSSKQEKIVYDPQIVLKILDELNEMNKQRSSTLVAIYLPTMADHDAIHVKRKGLRDFLQKELKKKGIAFWDLTADFQALPKDQRKRMYDDHYSQAGYEFVAKRVYSRLMQFDLLQRLPLEIYK